LLSFLFQVEGCCVQISLNTREFSIEIRRAYCSRIII